MVRAVADTHAVIWYLYNDARLSPTARTWIEDAAAAGEQIALSSITLAEMVYLIEKGRIDAAALTRLRAGLDAADAVLIEVPFDRDWQLAKARRQLRADKHWQKAIMLCLYRPFDLRWCYFSTVAMDYPRRELLDHVFRRDNLILGLGRQGIAVQADIWHLMACSRIPVDANIFRRGGINLFPVYLYPDAKNTTLFDPQKPTDSPGGRRPNLNPDFITDLSQRLGLRFIPDRRGDLSQTFGPEDVFHYAYAVFHSPTFRTRYAEFQDRLPSPAADLKLGPFPLTLRHGRGLWPCTCWKKTIPPPRGT